MHKKKGFTLIETVIAAAILAIVGASVYGIFAKMTRYSSDLRARSLAATMANENFEIIRNLPYLQVGVQGGIPAGLIPYTQTVTRGGKNFLVTTTIRNIDDPFDGTIGGTPNDLSPADNKLVEIQIDCMTCTSSTTTIFSGRVAPKNLETASNNGALFVKVFDANGQPVEGADVHLVHTKATTTIAIDDVTNVSGMLQIVDAPPGNTAWSIEVSKSGYSTDKTYATSTTNPTPSKGHATVLNQQVTQVSFVIDKTASLEIRSKSPLCSAQGNIDVSLVGTKLIGLPSLLKTNTDYSTNGSGIRTISNLEWDSYDMTIAGTSYDIAGTNPMLPWNILPDSTQSFDLIVSPRNNASVLALVKDASTGLPISGAEVVLSKSGYNETKITSQGHITQSDWSSGSYSSSDGNIETASPAGSLKLRYNSTLGRYENSGYLVSSIFDVGTTSNFATLEWLSMDQPLAAGANSVKFQIASSATNDAETVWDYVGPDGSASSFYTTSDTDLSDHDDVRYIRYKVYLSTADTTVTPQISDVSITYTTECTPPGQVFFNNLDAGTYSIDVTADGYDDYSENGITISSNNPSRKIILLERD